MKGRLQLFPCFPRPKPMPAPLLLLLAFSLPVQDPLEGQLPKNDLGVAAFLEAHPDYDGRGIRVAILDTGIDPGHPLLQKTSQGGRKIVDWYDATTDGRVETAREAQTENGTLIGLSGRRLRLGRWDRPGRHFHLGRVDAGFLPGDLKKRILEDRRQSWQRARRAHEEEKPAGTDSPAKPAGESDPLETEREEVWKRFDDPGPVYDLAVFRDENGWRVVVDNDEDGDLGEEPALRPFPESGDWATLGEEALLNYGVRVEEEGRRVILLFDAHGHGTHVSGIVGGWDGEGSRFNGIAPGVELVAIKIGDGKFGGATSGFSIARAIDYALEAGCQVANISFGGSSFFADGREPDARILEEAARRGLIVCTSAGNEGPALTTVGAPATSAGAWAVAAAVWPDTERVSYGSLDPSGPVLFDFSSRGPLPGGGAGISFTAPGAAVSSLPSWRMTYAENWNGTSMASPQMAGCAALMLSAARKEDLPASPARLKRAFQLGSQPIPGFTFVEQGFGAPRLLPVLAALKRLAALGPEETLFDVEVDNPFGRGAGIYERGPLPADSFERSVRVRPRFDEKTPHALRAGFERTFRIRAEADWVEVPPALFLNASGKSFPVRIDPRRLEPGLHSTRILLRNADRPQDVGPEVVVPVTVVVPLQPGPEGGRIPTQHLRLSPGGLQRTFAWVPHGARRVRIRVRQAGPGRNEFRIEGGSVSGTRFSGQTQKRERFFLEDGETHVLSVPVEEGTVFEFAAASRWSVNRPVQLILDLEFEGLEPVPAEVVVPAGQGLAYLSVKSPLRRESVTVSASVAGWSLPVDAPMKIIPDPIRARIFGGQGLFWGIVEQPFSVTEKETSTSLHIGAALPTTEVREDLMVEVSDSNGQVVKRTIAQEIDTDLGKLEPGDYALRLAFPSRGMGPLQHRFAGAELRFAVCGKNLALYGDLESAFRDGKKLGTLSLPAGGARTVIAALPELRGLSGGGAWFGRFTFQRDSETLLAVPLKIERPAPPPVPSLAENGAEESEVPAPEIELAFGKVPADSSSTPAARLAKARAWMESAPLCPRARLAWLQALAAAGLPERACAEACDFLARFPRETEGFLQAASAWNP